MTIKMETAPGKVKAFGLVRDQAGRPKIDDINNIPDEIWNLLTAVEQQEIEDGRNTSSITS